MAGRGTGADDSVMLQTVCHQLTKKPIYSSDQFVRGAVVPISRHLVTGSTARRLSGFHWLVVNARL